MAVIRHTWVSTTISQPVSLRSSLTLSSRLRLLLLSGILLQLPQKDLMIADKCALTWTSLKMDLRNVSILPQHYTLSPPRRRGLVACKHYINAFFFYDFSYLSDIKSVLQRRWKQNHLKYVSFTLVLIYYRDISYVKLFTINRLFIRIMNHFAFISSNRLQRDRWKIFQTKIVVDKNYIRFVFH
jgi:hypothetical protein